jgi:sec-independent protein translocase protein TatC
VRLLPRRLQHGEEATVTEHLGELRSRIVFCLLAIAFAFGFTYAFHGHLLSWLNRGLPPHFHPTTLSVTEPFLTSFWISFWAAVLLSMPVILWQIWGFFAPAFQKHTQRVVAAFSLFSAIMLAAGLLFGYFVVMKPAVHFLTNYDKTHYQIQIQAKRRASAFSPQRSSGGTGGSAT